MLGPLLQRGAELYSAWHSAPIGCRDRFIAAVAFCAGSREDRTFVVYLELSVVVLALALAVTFGRVTADFPLSTLCGRRRRRVVYLGADSSRFSDDGGGSSNGSLRGSRFGAARHGEARW